MKKLCLRAFSVDIGSNRVLSSIDLDVPSGDLHVIMGPNGAGKSSLARALAGHPSCIVSAEKATWGSHDLLNISPEERSRSGLFVSFQSPPELPGVSLKTFLWHSYKASVSYRSLPILSEEEFIAKAKLLLFELKLSEHFLNRCVNEGFSGGEKKRCEVLQMALLQPELVILDEVDSGLDVDALQLVVRQILSLRSCNSSILVITHYTKLVQLLEPDRVHVLISGKMVSSGGIELADMVEAKGYCAEEV